MGASGQRVHRLPRPGRKGAMTSSTKQQSVIALYAFAGGFADAASFLLFRSFAGHVTGNLVLMTISTASHRWAAALTRMAAIVSFLACTSAGFYLAQSRRKSLWLFLCQAALLVPVALTQDVFANTQTLGLLSVCCALGLQNGVVTSALGISVHSTFVSGDFTSLLKGGSKRSRSAQQHDAADYKQRVLWCVVAPFILGAFCAAVSVIAQPHFVLILLLIPLSVAAYLDSSLQ